VAIEGNAKVPKKANESVAQYLKAVHAEHRTGKATEHSYRPALKDLIEAQRRSIAAINEPRRVKCGAPDLVVNRRGLPVGFIECKDVGEDLQRVERSDQLKRYRGSLSNLILTDYLEFRYYVDGERTTIVRLADIKEKGKLSPIDGADGELLRLLDLFLDAKREIHTPKELAHYMAQVAKLIRETITSAVETEGKDGKLHDQFEAFKKVLLHDLTLPQFADMYAQTICYGLFAARCNVSEKDVDRFDRRSAAWDLPKTNPFLRKMFDQMAGPDLEESITWAVDHLIALLRDADIPGILSDFGRATKREDPVVHFYETFLAEYDPKVREARGVYYTPEPIVSYIVRRVDAILKSDFGLKDGLADDTMIDWEVTNSRTGEKEVRRVHKVQILDPATGTGTFLHEVIQLIHEKFEREGRKGQWSGYVREHLLPRLFGLEILMAPYAVAHMKLSLLLRQTGYDFSSDERLNVFLSNTLEEPEFRSETLFLRIIAEEANTASEVKQNAPIMVVIGNPPYSQKQKDYKIKDSDTMKRYRKHVRGEKRSGPLSNDYVRFLAFAHERIERTGHGVVGFITSNSYLDGIVHRGLRQELLHTFDTLHVLNLHGNSLPGRTDSREQDVSPRNVFDIQEGTAITLLSKFAQSKRKAVISYAEVLGSRDQKYQYLLDEAHNSSEGTLLEPSPENQFLFAPFAGSEHYSGHAVNEIFNSGTVGITTFRDHYAIALTSFCCGKPVFCWLVQRSIPTTLMKVRHQSSCTLRKPKIFIFGHTRP